MTTDDLASLAPSGTTTLDRLDQIEELVARVRSREIDASTALARIATLARDGDDAATYQKPWG